MSAYKSIAGEKAYIGNICHGKGGLVLFNTYADTQEVYQKIEESGIAYQNIKAEPIIQRTPDNEVMLLGYTVGIEGIPIESIFTLPDWKE